MLSDSSASDSNSPVRKRKHTSTKIVFQSSSDDDDDDDDSSPIKRISSRHHRLQSSDSSSDNKNDDRYLSSDEDIPIKKRRGARRLRVSSSDTNSSASSIAGPSQKKCKVILDSESSTDLEVEEAFRPWTSREKKNNKNGSEQNGQKATSNGKPTGNHSEDEGDNSSDSDGAERCIICFKTLRPPTAHPSNCNHNFHSECLMTWSKTSNTCPIDRVKYTAVLVTGNKGELISRHKVITPPPQNHNADFEPDETTFCEVCSQHDREHEMLLCDRCEAGYHLDCLTPPLTEVPTGNWYCPYCQDLVNGFDIADDEVQDILSDAVILGNRLRRRYPEQTQRLPRGPRTRGAQRVYNIIHQQQSLNQPSTSRSSRTRNSSGRRRRVRINNRSTNYNVEVITVEDGSTLRVKLAVDTRRSKSKRKKSSKKKKSCRGRANKSGDKGNQYDQQSASTSGTSFSAASSLDLFGVRPQLDYFSGCEAEDELDEDARANGGGSVGLLSRARTSVRSMAGRKQIAAQILNSRPRRPLPRIQVVTTPVDIVSSILEEQSKWHNPNAVIQGTSDGALKVIVNNQESAPVKKAAGGSNGERSGGNVSRTQNATTSNNSTDTFVNESCELSDLNSLPPLQPPPQPPKLCEDDDFDLYADIETTPSCKLVPPPPPPAMLLALEDDAGGSSPEDTMLVIDDERQPYDPDMPTSAPSSPSGENKHAESKVEGEGLNSGVANINLEDIRLPSPPLSRERVQSSDGDNDSDCPNRFIYSKASMEIAQDNSDSDSSLKDEPVKSKKRKSPLPVQDETDEESFKKPPSPQGEPPIEGEESAIKVSNDDEIEEQKSNEEVGSSLENSILTKEDGEINDDSMHEDEFINQTISEKSKYKTPLNDSPQKENLLNLKDYETEKGETIPTKNDDDNDSIELKEESSPKTIVDEVKKEDETDLKKEDEIDPKEEEHETKIGKELIDEKLEIDPSKSAENKDSQDDKELVSENNILDENYKPPSPPPQISSKENYDLSEGEELSDTNQGDEGLKKSKRSSKELLTHSSINGSQESLTTEERSETAKVNNVSKSSSNDTEKEGDDVLELGCEDDRDGLVDITDEEISNYERSWELEDNQAPTEKRVGLEGLETEAISDCEYTLTEERQQSMPKTQEENGPKEEGEIVLEDRVSPVAWKKLSKGTKERSYREKDTSKEKAPKKEKKKKEKRKELERYDVRKIISEKPKKRKVDEFGRDISSSKSRSGSRSRSRRRSISPKAKKRRSVEKRRQGSRKRSRERSRDKSRERSKRSRGRSRTRSRSRSRSGSKRLRTSRSPKAKSRGRRKSKERKKRRKSSISCSSCSCSSCEREKRKSKRVALVNRNKNSAKEDKRRSSKYRGKGSPKRSRRRNSPVPSKEVFTSGDNILVSVNFKSSKAGEKQAKESGKRKRDDDSRRKRDKSKENQPLRSIVTAKSGFGRKINTKNMKPIAIIDLDESPFREEIPSPKEVIILTDSDSEEKSKEPEKTMPTIVTGPKTPPEPHIKFNIINSKPQIRIISNPLLDSGDQNEDDVDEEHNEIMHKGPNTPPEPPVPYDPFEPTKSRSPTPIQDGGSDRNPSPPRQEINMRSRTPEPVSRVISPPKAIQHESPKTPSPLQSPPKQKQPEEVIVEKPAKQLPFAPSAMNDDDSMDMGGGGDSPYSPGSTEGDDLFEPPMPAVAPPIPHVKVKPRQNKHKLLPSPKKKLSKLKSKGNSTKKEVGIKLDEDQLKILDELPNSAVEMQVKDKFLKKLNRQERVVEEVKMVLKPHYAKKHVTKEEYKDILRKAVPKICHSRSGEINPMKIQRLIEAYVKKYRHKKKKKPNILGQPLQMSKPTKPKTMWC